MTFQPVVPLSGYTGWTFLQRTLEDQTQAYRQSPLLNREVAYAREAMGSIVSAEELVQDRQLLKVALGAFGLDEDLDNKAFVQKILEDGTTNSTALANRLADKQYYALAEAFAFGDGGIPGTLQQGFVDRIVEAYQDRSFEVAIGEQDNSLRLALNFEREIDAIASGNTTADTKWYTVMGNAPLREVFDTALGLPDEFATIDIDQQLEVYQDRLFSMTGSSDIGALADPEAKEDFIRLYLLRSDLANGPSRTTPGLAAVTLLANANASSSLLQTALLG